MLNLLTPFYQRKRFLTRRRPIRVWTFMRRHQLVELFGFTGVIALIWLGAHFDNRWSNNPPQQPLGIESAQADLVVGVPVGKHRVAQPSL